ncbi:MAG: DUF6320 domain-containing protein [Lachnospiraceae bacterium]|jgi:hypothetical protein|nr:DUF6320 domain-containing protein [Lachnospiraceae bacterium]
MQYCPKCRIQIRGHKKCCPLCQGRLTGEPEDSPFPVVRKSLLTGIGLIRIATFIFLASEIAMGTAAFLATSAAHHPIPWIPIVMTGGVVVWLDLVVAFNLRNNILKIITFEAYIAMIIDYVIDRMTGFAGWSVVWMIPATFLGLAVVTLAIGKAAKLHLEDYIIYILFDTLFSMLQIIPIVRGQNHFEWMAVVCMALYLILFTATLIFRFSELRNATEKFFNV